MFYDINTVASDCYEGTVCLINKFDIKDSKQLSQVEADITFAKSAKLEQTPIKGNFDIFHYKNIHRFLFEDLYEWAGQFRTINLSKKGTNFADYKNIEKYCEMCFSGLSRMNFLNNLAFDKFIDEIVELYCTLNLIHPFREGNGRTQRIFIAQLIRFNGYEINFSDIDTDYLMIATIQSAQGIFDNLKQIFKDNIKR